jgi:purine nucleosidase
LIIHDNDGHVDDLLSSLLLWLHFKNNLQAISVTDGDCYVQQAYESLVKMATFLDLEGPEIGISEEPIPNPFPDNWRRESYIINELPIFSENALKRPYQVGKPRKSELLIADCLSHSKEPITIVATGPLTNLARVLQHKPELKSKIKEFIIMGGAINVRGNVEQPNHDGSAEWNFYGDPPSAKAIFDTGIPIILIPLDVTNQVPINKEFLEKLEEQSSRYRASLLAAKLYSLVKGLNYYFWDTLTAAAAIEPNLFVYKDMRLDVSAQGKNAGKTMTSLFGGRKIKVAISLDKEKFENLFLKTLQTK